MRNASVLPSFLVIGAMKAGTTSLYEYLRSHPQVYMPQPKELDFFSTGIADGLKLSDYSHHFDLGRYAIAKGEASTSYTKAPAFGDVAGRIAGCIPDIRLVYVVRHPVERMRSQYVHEVWLGTETRSIDDALLTDPRYLDVSRYHFQLETYLRRFRREQILVITTEDLRSKRKPTIERVFSFVGVDPSFAPGSLSTEFHASVGKRRPGSTTRLLRRSPAYRALAGFVPASLRRVHHRFATHALDSDDVRLNDDLRRHLESLLRDDVRALRAVVGGDFDGWGLV